VGVREQEVVKGRLGDTRRQRPIRTSGRDHVALPPLASSSYWRTVVTTN